MDYKIHSSAPIRICDLGGWTDTSFSETGNVLNFAVRPRVHCLIELKSVMEKAGKVAIVLPNLNQAYLFRRDIQKNEKGNKFIDTVLRCMTIPSYADLKIKVFSDVPPGSSTGTSAAVMVSILGALMKLNNGIIDSKRIIEKAHNIETIDLARNAGVQDQICSVFGGICFIKINAYPKADTVKIQLKRETIDELNRRLFLIYLGGSHDSSKVHQQVISEIKKGRKIEVLRELTLMAEMGLSKLKKNDLEGFGEIMIYNHELQEKLHKNLINNKAKKVIEIARNYGFVGWKVNGAGGLGGSITILSNEDFKEKDNFLSEVSQTVKGCYSIPIQICDTGLSVSYC